MTNPITAVTRELAKHVELKDALEAMHESLDPQALLDTLEGETDLNEVLQKIAAQALEYEALAKATAERKVALQERESRLKNTAQTLRAIILQAMDTGNIPKITGPEMTLSTRVTPPVLVVDDESLIPTRFFVTQDPKLDKKSLTESLTTGGDLPGAHLSNGGIGLTIRVK